MLRRHFLTALTVTSAAALTGCGIYGIGNPGVEDVVGRWIETTPGVTGEQGYVFAADGKVTSFGFANREARTYTCYRGLMELKGVVKTASGGEMGFTHSYVVTQEGGTMTLTQGYKRRTFRRAE